jgi:hypothetical protein
LRRFPALFASVGNDRVDGFLDPTDLRPGLLAQGAADLTGKAGDIVTDSANSVEDFRLSGAMDFSNEGIARIVRVTTSIEPKGFRTADLVDQLFNS